MSAFLLSFTGAFIGSAIAVYFASTYFYSLGKKHGALIERKKFIVECLDAVDSAMTVLPEKNKGAD